MKKIIIIITLLFFALNILPRYFLHSFLKQQTLNKNSLISWEIQDSTHKLFSSTYFTLVQIAKNEKILVTHEITFFPNNIKSFSFAQINSFGYANNSSFSSKSIIKINELITDINIEKYLLDINAKFNFFDKTLMIYAKTPKLNTKHEEAQIVIEDFYLSADLFLADNERLANKLLISASNFDFVSPCKNINIKDFKTKNIFTKNSNNTLDTNIQFDFAALKYNLNCEEKPQVVFNGSTNITLLNINENSAKKILQALVSTRFSFDSYSKFMLLGVFSHELNYVLEKQPELFINNININYENKLNKLSGFIKYVDKGKSTKIKQLNQYLKDVHGEFDVSLGEELYQFLVEFLTNKNLESLKLQIENIKKQEKNANLLKIKIEYKNEHLNLE